MKETATIILYDKNNKLLLQLRTPDAPVLPDYWSFFGGHLEDGESCVDAVHREILEELNYQLINPTKFLTKELIIEGINYREHFFIEKCVDKSCMVLGEGADWGWFSIEELESLKMTKEDLAVVREFFSQKVNT